MPPPCSVLVRRRRGCSLSLSPSIPLFHSQAMQNGRPTSACAQQDLPSQYLMPPALNIPISVMARANGPQQIELSTMGSGVAQGSGMEVLIDQTIFLFLKCLP